MQGLLSALQNRAQMAAEQNQMDGDVIMLVRMGADNVFFSGATEDQRWVLKASVPAGEARAVFIRPVAKRVSPLGHTHLHVSNSSRADTR